MVIKWKTEMDVLIEHLEARGVIVDTLLLAHLADINELIPEEIEEEEERGMLQ